MNEQTDNLLATAEENLRVMQAAGRSYRDDPEFRARLEAAPRAALADVGLDIGGPEIEMRVRANTEDTFYMVMPADPNTSLSDETLADVTGGSTVSSAGSAGSGSTVSTPVSSLSSAGTAGSAGSVNPNG